MSRNNVGGGSSAFLPQVDAYLVEYWVHLVVKNRIDAAERVHRKLRQVGHDKHQDEFVCVELQTILVRPDCLKSMRQLRLHEWRVHRF